MKGRKLSLSGFKNIMRSGSVPRATNNSQNATPSTPSKPPAGKTNTETI